MVNGTRKNFYDVYPKTGKEYADGRTWFINNDRVKFDGRNYVKYGLPRVLGLMEIEKRGTYDNVGVYAESGLDLDKIVEVIYIPVRQGCEFQPSVILWRCIY
jgi:hypothetical protein